MVIPSHILVIFFFAFFIENSREGCVLHKGSENSLYNLKEEEVNNSRPNLFIDENRLTGGHPKEGEHKPASHGIFSYGGAFGASNWYKTFPKCAGSKQSPINIPLATIKNVQEKPLHWSTSYSELPVQMTLINAGTTVVLHVTYNTSTALPELRGGPLPSNASYSLEQVHFHWGSSNHRGSEHTIEGKSFPMEMHAVHRRSDLPMANATMEHRGLAVVGYIFEIEANCHPALDYLLEHFGMLKMDHDVPVPLTNLFKLKDLTERFQSDYVTYEGSLTTPPCHESVIWIISPHAIGVTEKQLSVFRSLYSSTPDLKNNYRPVQPLNGRNISYVIVK